MEGSTLPPPYDAIEYEPNGKNLFLFPMIRMIAACARNRVMGAGGTLPWKIEEDWNYFMQTTKDGVLLMGRKCYEDFTDYAPTRKLVVLSRNQEKIFDHALKASTLQEAIQLGWTMGKNLWICGGEEIYREAMPLAEELYLTLIDEDFEGDVHFPHWQKYFTEEISRREIICDGKKLTFLILGK